MLGMTEKIPRLSMALVKKHKLTKKQAGFIREYIKPNISQARAVFNAGYNAKNMDNASRIGNELIKNPRVCSALDEIIYGNALDQEISDTYKEILTQRFDNEDVNIRIKAQDLKLKAIQQLNRLKGKEAPKKTEHVRKTASFQTFLPAGSATINGSVMKTDEQAANQAKPLPISPPGLPLIEPASEIEEKKPGK